MEKKETRAPPELVLKKRWVLGGVVEEKKSFQQECNYLNSKRKLSVESILVKKEQTNLFNSESKGEENPDPNPTSCSNTKTKGWFLKLRSLTPIFCNW